MDPPDPQEPEEGPAPEIPPPLRVPEEYPGGAPERPSRRRADPEEPGYPEKPWF